MSHFFEEIDAVYVINLDSRADRWTAFIKTWEHIIPTHKITRISAVTGTEIPGYGQYPWFRETTGERARSWGGGAGCILSHQKAIEQARNNELESVLIMEDDAIPSETVIKNGMNDTLLQFAKSKNDCGILYLGCTKVPATGRMVMKGAENCGDLWQLSGVLTTHAYMICKRSYDALLTNLPDETTVWDWLAKYRAIDAWLYDFYARKSGLSVYAVLPSFIIQSESQSDIPVQNQAKNPTSPTYPTPRNLGSIFYPLYLAVTWPYRRVKNDMNSFRTLRRAQKHGFPGFKKKREPLF